MSEQRKQLRRVVIDPMLAPATRGDVARLEAKIDRLAELLDPVVTLAQLDLADELDDFLIEVLGDGDAF